MHKSSISSKFDSKIAFFLSSIGDSDLAKSTIFRLIELGIKDTIFVIPVAKAANDRVAELSSNPQIKIVSIDAIIQKFDALSNKKIYTDEQELINKFITNNKIQRAFIGVTSVLDEEISFQIATTLNIPCTIVYEFMFKPSKHCFWGYMPQLACKEKITFAVPLNSAFEDFYKFNSNLNIKAIGHLCIDRAQNLRTSDVQSYKNLLGVQNDQDMTFISGTTQPIEIDNLFLDAILQELSTGNYPHHQIRFGVHPGINRPDPYMLMLLATSDKYPKAQLQLKIVLDEKMQKKLTDEKINDHNSILHSNISGSNMTLAADRVAQSVPGALLNESALVGKPSYFHDKNATPYLPAKWFSKSISEFFTARPAGPHHREELELNEPAPSALASLLC